MISLVFVGIPLLSVVLIHTLCIWKYSKSYPD